MTQPTTQPTTQPLTAPNSPTAAGTRSDLLAAALSSDMEQADRDSRLPAESVEALRACGAFAWRTPTANGGAWSDPVTIARGLTDLGRLSPSAAWVAGVCATSKTMVELHFGADAPPEAFADPNVLACGSGARSANGVRVGGDLRVSGRWPSVSGCEDAEWAGLAVTVDGRMHWTVIPIRDLRIEHTWQMTGMRGTGSHTLVADELLVPGERVALAAMPGPAQRIFFPLTVLAPVVGAAYGALDVIRAMFASPRKPYATSYTRMDESPGARHWLAEADRLVSRAGRTMLSLAQDASDSATDDWAEVDQVRSSTMLADVARECRAAVDLMLDLHGASGLSLDNPLQRYWRDVTVGCRHPLLNPYLAAERLGSIVGA